MENCALRLHGAPRGTDVGGVDEREQSTDYCAFALCIQCIYDVGKGKTHHLVAALAEVRVEAVHKKV